MLWARLNEHRLPAKKFRKWELLIFQVLKPARKTYQIITGNKVTALNKQRIRNVRPSQNGAEQNDPPVAMMWDRSALASGKA